MALRALSRDPASRARRCIRTALSWLLHAALVALGLWALVRESLKIFGGGNRLWLFEARDEHRFTAMAMLTGTLRLRSGISHIHFDEQFLNGAGYTNWGFGVPLLQLPFHAYALRWRAEKFFPDRAIFFAYLTALIAVLWAAFYQLAGMRRLPGKIRRGVLAWAATALTLACSLYPLMSCRFIVYEETLCYFVVFELLALCAYIFALRCSWTLPAACGLGLAAGLGLLIRPTGLVHLGVWTALVLLESTSRRSKLAFLVTVAPSATFWAFSNWVKGGAPLALGFSNAVIENSPQAAMVRFGSLCADTTAHKVDVAKSLFHAFFFGISELSTRLKGCSYQYEERPPAVHEPFFGGAVLALLIWMFLHQAVRRDRKLAAFVPFGGMVAIFLAYVYAGAGFAWRYVGDFWPLIILACVQYVYALPRAAKAILGFRSAAAFVAVSLAGYYQSIAPWTPLRWYTDQWETAPPTASASMWQDFTASRWGVDKPLSSRARCGEPPDWPVEGWYPTCKIDAVTNVFLHVNPKKDDRHELRLEVEGVTANALSVYVNGHVYTAHREGKTYSAAVRIQGSRLVTPTVMATVDWRSPALPDGSPDTRLVSIELE